MACKRKTKKGEFLDAFKKGNIGKVMEIAKHVPDSAKVSIHVILKLWKKEYSAKKMTPICVAILHGHYHLCELLVEDGVPLKGDYEKQLRPLSLALENKQTDIAELFIRSGADVNMLENDGDTYPLFWAIKQKQPPHIIEKILLAGFPVNGVIVRAKQMRPIQCAAWKNNMEAAEVLVKHSVDLNMTNISGETALNIAVGGNFPSMVKFLVKSGANLHNRNALMCPLLLAIRLEHLTMVEVLLDLGASIEDGWVQNEIVPPLQFALSYLNLDIAMILINRGANVNSKNISSHETPLHLATTYVGLKYSGNTLREIQVKIARLLIEKGADINAKDCYGKTPLDGAVFSENTELCKLLLREGAEVAGTGWIRGDGILSNRFEYIACVGAFKCPELINLCLERGGDYNYRDRHGLSPYHCALAKFNPAMVKVFWQHGCPYDQPEHQPGKMKTMLWYNPNKEDQRILAVQADFMDGIKNNKIELVISALERGAEPRGCSMKIPSTLHYLATTGNYKIARVLLEAGVPVNRINEKGQTPLYLAVQKKNLQSCQVFLQFGACYNYHHTGSEKSLKELVREYKQIHDMFKDIYKSFKLVKQGNYKLLTILQQYLVSENFDMFYVLMNCVNSKGLSLMGTALSLGYTEIARDLMTLRLKNL